MLHIIFDIKTLCITPIQKKFSFLGSISIYIIVYIAIKHGKTHELRFMFKTNMVKINS
jgi:NADH:ubiquinone oxidoreductase subunit 3 (subunit A)